MTQGANLMRDLSIIENVISSVNPTFFCSAACSFLHLLSCVGGIIVELYGELTSFPVDSLRNDYGKREAVRG